jgi:hypothetical protein
MDIDVGLPLSQQSLNDGTGMNSIVFSKNERPRVMVFWTLSDGARPRNVVVQVR